MGVELPTASHLSGLSASVAPSQQAQLQLGAGRWNTHLSANFAGARGRWVYGTDAECVFRHGRDDVKIGDEFRWNLDLEHIAFPRDYQKAGGEVFCFWRRHSCTVVPRAGRVCGLTEPAATVSRCCLASSTFQTAAGLSRFPSRSLFGRTSVPETSIAAAVSSLDCTGSTEAAASAGGSVSAAGGESRDTDTRGKGCYRLRSRCVAGAELAPAGRWVTSATLG